LRSCPLPAEENVNKRDFCEAVLKCCGAKIGLTRGEYQLGLTKVFFRPGKQQFLEDLLNSSELSPHASESIRKFLLTKKFTRVRAAIRVALHLQRLLQQTRFRVRCSQAALMIQTCWRRHSASKLLNARKNSVAVIEAFYLESCTRRKLVSAMRERIRTNHAQRTQRAQRHSVEAGTLTPWRPEQTIINIDESPTMDRDRQNRAMVEHSRRLKARSSSAADMATHGSDPALALLSRGTSFMASRGATSCRGFAWSDIASGALQWVADDEQQQASYSFQQIDKVDSTHDSLVVCIKGGEVLSKQASADSTPGRTTLGTLGVALRYALDNVRVTGSVERAATDPRRINELAWELLLENEQLLLENEQLKRKGQEVEAGSTVTVVTPTVDVEPQSEPPKQPPKEPQMTPRKRKVVKAQSPALLVDIGEDKENASRGPVAPLRVSSKSNVTMSVVVWFPDNSQVTTQVLQDQTLASVVSTIASTVCIRQPDGFSLFEVDEVGEEKLVQDVKELFGARGRLLFKRKIDLGDFAADPVATKVVYWQIINDLCQSRLGVPTQDWAGLLAMHRGIVGNGDVMAIGSFKTPADLAELKNMSPYMFEVATLEGSLGKTSTLSPIEKKDAKKRLAVVKKVAATFKATVKKLQSATEKELKKTTGGVKPSMANFIVRMEKYALFACQLYYVTQDDTGTFPAKMYVSLSFSSLHLAVYSRCPCLRSFIFFFSQDHRD
jgi:hypothetical protein